MKPYTIPVGLWLASAFGLVTMLLGDQVWDVVGLLCLAAPAVAIAWAMRRNRAT